MISFACVCAAHKIQQLGRKAGGSIAPSVAVGILRNIHTIDSLPRSRLHVWPGDDCVPIFFAPRAPSIHGPSLHSLQRSIIPAIGAKAVTAWPDRHDSATRCAASGRTAPRPLAAPLIRPRRRRTGVARWPDSLVEGRGQFDPADLMRRPWRRRRYHGGHCRTVGRRRQGWHSASLARKVGLGTTHREARRRLV